MNLDLEVKLAVYRHFSEQGHRPSAEDIATGVGAGVADVLGAFGRLRAQRVLVLERDGAAIRMAPPFSGVPTPHVTAIDGSRYFANCAWDALGIAAAMRRPATVHSRCGQSGSPLRLSVELDGPERCDWLFHCPIPAAHWWDDIVFT